MLKYIDEHKLQDYVTIDGTFGDRNYLRKLYHSVDVLIQPTKDQGGWISPLEAICSGLPVVASEDAVFANYFKEHKLANVTNDYKNALFSAQKLLKFAWTL